tara:strand:+ start:1936 stop:2298 length:363 start_codon:yes stop_codon:yes gene_type:complete
MARLLKGLPEEFKNMKLSDNVTEIYRFCDDWNENYRLEEEAFKALAKRALFIWQFEMADSGAYYEVVQLKPLQLRWIPYMDQWEAPAYVIRGIQTKDIMEDMKWQRNWKLAIANAKENVN